MQLVECSAICEFPHICNIQNLFNYICLQQEELDIKQDVVIHALGKVQFGMIYMQLRLCSYSACIEYLHVKNIISLQYYEKTLISQEFYEECA